MLRKPGLLRGGVGRTEPHDFEGRSVELAFGLLPVAAVDEKRGSALRHAQAGGAAREAREPGNGLPVFGNVFREMRIDDAADPGVKPRSFMVCRNLPSRSALDWFMTMPQMKKVPKSLRRAGRIRRACGPER